ncbi:ParB-like protein [Oribacterium parvum ACB8]|jgi:chromosome partitioning protein, parB family|uniref:ParB/RepB/Spo0J family partition protein n=1 Tax=Oribacterium parvum TaxID=1501329 RepID=UPI00026F074E|nr:ParB N-terminal domain-containing protein [Oribacterium parvum]EJF13148.1 ParB-like protein [Oribacterium parvum ACB8]
MKEKFKKLDIQSTGEFGLQDVKADSLLLSSETYDDSMTENQVEDLGSTSQKQSLNPSGTRFLTFNKESMGEAFEAFNGKNPFNFKRIPREKIVFNENNDFSMENIEELANSLLKNGLEHNLTGHYDDDRDLYILESGERRIRALDLLNSKFGSVTRINELPESEQENFVLFRSNILPLLTEGIPFKVNSFSKEHNDENGNRLDEIRSELRKYATNLDVRQFTPKERSEYISKVKKLLEEEASLLGKNKVTKDEIADAIGISRRQLHKYELLDSLIPRFKELFENKKLRIEAVSTLSGLTEEEQQAICNRIDSEDDAQAISFVIQDYVEAKECKKQVAEELANLSENPVLFKEKQKEKMQQDLAEKDIYYFKNVVTFRKKLDELLGVIESLTAIRTSSLDIQDVLPYSDILDLKDSLFSNINQFEQWINSYEDN